MYRTLKSEPYSSLDLIIPDDQPLTWNIEPQRCALLVHDMQRYFVNALPSEPIDKVIHSISLVLKWARINHIPVFYSAQPGGMTLDQRGLLNDLWGPGMRTTEDERRIITELTPSSDDTVLTKWRYSAFYRSPLAEMLKKDQRDSLIITGVYASVGISATAIEAFTQDIKPFVVADAVADFSLAGHQQAINYLADNCAQIISTDGVINNV
ncbi:isochorismatase family protein [Pectobacterium parvum]|uniref:Isochorismatase family protein n=1 Tax=Pectobacterium parvum TaxID=2778550 RepID=A0AAP9IJ33_9GAMM|nr:MULTISPECIES: isochorismatase family protein [Pectobacterium]GKW44291.1 phenazine biosynthesis protein PhzD [Pectobacterium carotovorum subsp. carotovorum]MCU1803719.1 isochorismatase family protein [Pectobacterium parvum]QHQ26315.1 isochorismatase family protein [Pectobacterium parvum]UFK38014.1 isochorismatase family protein [Pectobacterium parvum]UVD98923.1 isochorismatase family protein [Pectobacterium parvum]